MNFHEIVSFPNVIWLCLQSTGKALHEIVVYSYHQQQPILKEKFFLVGYKQRTSRCRKQQLKLYDNPSISNLGFNIKWLLRNIRWHKKMYADHLRLYEDSLEEIVDFLLVDIFEYGFAELRNEINNFEFLASDCFAACLELVTAILESDYYKSISKLVVHIKSDIENQYLCLKKLNEHLVTGSIDIQRVIDFMNSGNLIKEFEKEKKHQENQQLNHFESVEFNSDHLKYVIEHEDTLNNTAIDSSIVFIDHVPSTPCSLITKSNISLSTTPLILQEKENFGDLIDIDESYVLV